MSRIFPPAQPKHFAAMLTAPNRKKTFIINEDGKMVNVGYVYGILSRDETEHVLFVQRMKYFNEIVRFQVGELKEYRSILKINK